MHNKNEDEYILCEQWKNEKKKKQKGNKRDDSARMNDYGKRGKEDIDHEYVFLLCSTQVGSSLVILLYVNTCSLN